MSKDYDIAGPNDPNTLRLPFMFVPHGCKPTPAWLQAHPGAIRIPAVMVPRDPGPGESGPQWNVQLNFPNEPASTAPAVAAAPPADEAASLPVDPPAPAGRNTYGAYVTAGDPIAVWRTMKAVLDDPARAAGIVVAVSDTTTSGMPGSSANANPASGAPGPSAADIREDARLGLRRLDTPGQRGPTAPVLFVDDEGRPVLGQDNEPMFRPFGLDPHFFVKKGLEAKKDLQRFTALGSETGRLLAASYLIAELSLFLWTMPRDAQRWGHWFDVTDYPEFCDYATVAVGLFAAAAGIPRDSILLAQDVAAFFGSRFSSKEDFGGAYTFLPTRNVGNTDIGYGLYESGRIKGAPSP